MKQGLSSDLATGLLFLALGGFVIIYGLRYPMGTAVRMGPGYFPSIVAAGLVLLGAALVVRSFVSRGELMTAISFRPLMFVLIGTLAFGLLIDRAGFWLASLTLVVATRLADRGFRPLEVAALACFLTALITVIFRYALGLPLQLMPF